MNTGGFTRFDCHVSCTRKTVNLNAGFREATTTCQVVPHTSVDILVIKPPLCNKTPLLFADLRKKGGFITRS